MKHFFGIVEDRNDPLKIGRVRVRVHGIHTDNKLELSTPDLPQVLLPTTTNWSFRYRMQHGLVEGTTVFDILDDHARPNYIWCCSWYSSNGI